MSRKSELYQLLKSRGVTFEKQYVHYTEKELEALFFEDEAKKSNLTPTAEALANDLDQEFEDGRTDLERLADMAREEWDKERAESVEVSRTIPRTERSGRQATARSVAQKSSVPSALTLVELEAVVAQQLTNGLLREGAVFPFVSPKTPTVHQIPVKNDPADRAGLTYSHPDDVPIRIDLQGRIWFMDEVQKPSIPKARMTRKTRYIDSGVKEKRTYFEDGRLDEVYEVAGDEKRELTVSVTLPSWQVGRYKDLRYPFSIHTYNGERGFDRVEIVRYFGGTDLVPGTIKMLYVGNQLCYHIPSTINTIRNEFQNIQKRG